MTLSNFISLSLFLTVLIAAVIFFIKQKCEIERIEKKLDSHMGDASKQNEELKRLIEEAKLSAKRHSDNNADGIKQFIKELSIKEIKETLTNES